VISRSESVQLFAGRDIYIVVNDERYPCTEKKMRRLDARSMVLFGVPFGLDLCEIAASIIHSLLLPLQSLSQLALLCCFLLSFCLSMDRHCKARRAIQSASGSLHACSCWLAGRPLEAIGRQAPKELKQIRKGSWPPVHSQRKRVLSWATIYALWWESDLLQPLAGSCSSARFQNKISASNVRSQLTSRLARLPCLEGLRFKNCRFGFPALLWNTFNKLVRQYLRVFSLHIDSAFYNTIILCEYSRVYDVVPTLLVFSFLYTLDQTS
jgi:hypothetical protein